MRLLLLLCLFIGLPFHSVQAQYYAVRSDSAAAHVAVPKAVVTSFRQVFPALSPDSLIRWKIFDADSSYGVTIGKYGRYGKAAFDAKGVVTETFLEVQLKVLPKPVQLKIKQEVLPWLKKTFPKLTPNLCAHIYTVEAEVAYYVIDFYNITVPRRSRDWLIQPNGNYYPRGSPVFR